MQKKRILLFGANGQLGRSIYVELSPYFDVIPCININKKGAELFENSEISVDISNSNDVQSTIQKFSPEIVINSAAFTNVDKCETDKETAFKVNVKGLKNLVKYSSKKTHIIQISTDYVFDGEKGDYSEFDPTYPKSYYGKTKLEAENYLRGTDSNWLILRPNVLFGNNLNSNSSFVSWVYNSLKQNKQINVVTDQISNPTWTTAFAQAIRQCIIMKTKGLFHYGSDDKKSRFDFAKLIARTFDLDEKLINPITTKELKQKAKRPLKSDLNPSKIIREVGVQTYTLDYSLEQIKRINFEN